MVLLKYMLRKILPRKRYKKKKRNKNKNKRKKVKRYKKKYKKIKRKQKKLKNNKKYIAPIYFFNNPVQNKYLISKLKLLKYCIRYFKLLKNMNKKRKIFVTKIILLSLYKIIRFIKKSLKKKLFMIFLLLQKQWISYNFNLLKYTKLLKKNFNVFFLYTKIVHKTLQKTFWKSTLKKNNNLVCKYYILNNSNFTANFLCNYILVKLAQMFTLNKILNPLLRHLKKTQDLFGYRFVISGRLTRQERAAYTVKSYRAMPLSTIKTTIDYASDFKILKFGVVGLKIYLLYKSNHPYNSFYEFKINNK